MVKVTMPPVCEKTKGSPIAVNLFRAAAVLLSPFVNEKNKSVK